MHSHNHPLSYSFLVVSLSLLNIDSNPHQIYVWRCIAKAKKTEKLQKSYLQRSNNVNFIQQDSTCSKHINININVLNKSNIVNCLVCFVVNLYIIIYIDRDYQELSQYMACTLARIIIPGYLNKHH